MTNNSLTQNPARNQAVINFHGQQLITAEKDGIHYAAMKPIAKGMELDWRSSRQLIERDPVLNSTRCIIHLVAQDGRNRETICLPIQYLNGWLFKINAGRYAEDDPRREVIIRYQKECYQVLYDYWHKGAAVKPEYHKRCAMCESVLPLSEFRQDKRYHGGYNPVCNSCRRPRPRLRIQPPKPTKEEVLDGILEHYVAIQRIIKEDDTLSIHDLTEEEQDQGIQYYARWLVTKGARRLLGKE